MGADARRIVPNLLSKSIRLLGGVSCGWPTPAVDYEEAPLSLDELVGITACSTFLMRARGESMINAGIYDGDILVVDRSAKATTGRVVVAIVDGDFTVKRLEKNNGRHYLKPENPVMRPIEFEEGMEVAVWGVATWCLHRLD